MNGELTQCSRVENVAHRWMNQTLLGCLYICRFSGALHYDFCTTDSEWKINIDLFIEAVE